MVGPDGLEPSTPRLSSACSNQLSYEPKVVPGQAWDLGYNWWSRRDSNSRPPACKAGALPTELRPQDWVAVTEKEQRFSKSTLCDQLEPGNFRLLRPSARRIAPLRRLLRKEVIQPQVPLRLPCYDFVPITSLTLGRRFHCWLANALRAKPAFMT